MAKHDHEYSKVQLAAAPGDDPPAKPQFEQRCRICGAIKKK